MKEFGGVHLKDICIYTCGFECVCESICGLSGGHFGSFLKEIWRNTIEKTKKCKSFIFYYHLK